MFNLLSRPLNWLALGAMLSLLPHAYAAEPAPESLRIGYQKGSVSMVLAKTTSCWKNVFRKLTSPGSSFRQARKCWKH